MIGHVLLNVSKRIEKKIKCDACQTFYHFFDVSLIYSMIHNSECYILSIICNKITLKLHFWSGKSRYFDKCTQRYYGRYYITLYVYH